jgi:hypothetical protein
MRASEIPVGSGFVGYVESHDLSSGDKRKFDGALVFVVVVVPGPTDEDTEKLVMAMFAGLDASHGQQLSGDTMRWVAGVRGKRSRYVRIFDWLPRCSVGGAQNVRARLIKEEGER